MEQKKKLMCGLCHLVMVCCLCVFFPIVRAQSVYQLSVDNALPNNYVRAILQDKYGYLWMGTTSGLTRYDGYQVEVLKPSTMSNRKLLQDFRILGIKPWGRPFLVDSSSQSSL